MAVSAPWLSFPCRCLSISLMFQLLLLPALALALENGVYEPIQSNNSSVCPQVIKTFRDEESQKLTALEVTYIGDCYYQGPYEHYCYDEPVEEGGTETQLVCWSPLEIRFIIRDSKSYRWENQSYEIWAEFERQDRS